MSLRALTRLCSAGLSASYLRDAGGRHWGELWDVGPLHSCVGRNILEVNANVYSELKTLRVS